MKVKSDHRSKFSNLSNIGRKKPEKYQSFNMIQTCDLRDMIYYFNNNNNNNNDKNNSTSLFNLVSVSDQLIFFLSECH